MALDVLAVRASVDDPVVGVGHSMGGAALVLAELLRPGSFDALVLVEPIILPPPYCRDERHPLVSRALRRRAGFESREDARATYVSKPPFDAWDPTALDGYLDGGFHPAGNSFTLACRPCSEAEVFAAAGIHAAWERLGEVSFPVTILYGADTDTYPPGHAERLAARFGRGTAIVVPDTGHFVPMERPEPVAAAVRRAAAALS
jgi:lipase